MLMGLSEYLELRYPRSIFGSHCMVSADGTTITKWDETRYGPQPTPEQIVADMPAVLVLKTKREKMKELKKTDAGMARVTEDIWDVLKAKNLVSDLDLPATSAAKLANRRALREALK